VVGNFGGRNAYDLCRVTGRGDLARRLLALDPAVRYAWRVLACCVVEKTVFF